MKFILMLLLPSVLLGAPGSFQEACTAKPEPRGFSTFLEDNFSSVGKPISPRDTNTCKAFAAAAEKMSSVFTTEPLDDISILRFFPNLESMTINLGKNNNVLKVGHHKKLISLSLTGNLAVKDLSDFTKSSGMLSLFIIGSGPKTAAVNIEGIEKLTELNNIVFKNVSITQAKRLEGMKQIIGLHLENAKLDTELDWKQFPNLKLKVVK